MKIKIEQNVKKTLKVSFIFLAIGLMLGALIVFAATPSSTFYISSGIYPGAPSYTVEKEGSNYFAKDDHGQIKFDGTNATEVYENARNDISSGTILFASGTYVFTHSLWLQNNIDVIGEGIGNTIFKQHSGSDLAGLIRAGSDALGIAAQHNITLRDFTVYGVVSGSESNNGLDFANCSHITVRNVEVYNVLGNGVRFTRSSEITLSNIYVENVVNNQAYSFMGFFNSQLDNLQAVNCGSYGLDLSYAVNVTVNNILLKGENTTLKIDLGNNAGEYSDCLTLSNIIILDFAGYQGIEIEETYNTTITNFLIAGGSRGIRVGTDAYSVVVSNGIISNMVSNGVYLFDGDHLVFSNIILKDTDSTCFSISATVNYAMLNSINAREGGLILDSGTGTHVSDSWNSTTWIA